MEIRKLTIAIGVVLGLGSSASTYATDLAMAQPSNLETIPSIVSYDPENPNATTNFRDPRLICNLANLYATGQGVEQNDEKAFQLYQYAAINGIADAQYAIALMYSEERSAANVADAQGMAIYWLEKAMSQGHKDAEFTYEYLLNNTHYSGC